MPQGDSGLSPLNRLGAVPIEVIQTFVTIKQNEMALLPCILVVDDDPVVTKLCSAILKPAGFEIITASSGRQVIPLLKRWRVDMVITDLVMPEQEGIETILALRSGYPKLPVVAMGEVKHLSYLHTATILGAKTALIKPFLADDLLDLVNSVLGMQPEYEIGEIA